MKMNNKLLYMLSFILMFSIGCEDDDAAAEAQAYDPAGEYVFPSRLIEGNSSVSYTGQVVRNMLHSDLKSLTDLVTTGPAHSYVTYNLLNSYFAHDDSPSMQPSFVASPDACEAVYVNIATGKNLSGKTADGNLRGWSIDATTAVQAWMQAIADSYAANPNGGKQVVTSSDGLNYSQMINKTLYGAVAYDQAFTYLANYDDAMPDNVDPKSEGGSYTVAEHKWDEAFGYFGARRDFLTPGDVGSCIDLTSEHNFGWASYATKRDNDTENIAYRNGVMFKADIFNAFVAGRAIIHNEGTIDELAPHMATIRTRFEQLCAANVVHYVHSVLNAMGDLTSTSGAMSSESENYNKYWSEMRGFIISLQYNVGEVSGGLTSAQLDQIVAAVGTAPKYPSHDGYSSYADDLQSVKTILSTLF